MRRQICTWVSETDSNQAIGIGVYARGVKHTLVQGVTFGHVRKQGRLSIVCACDFED